MDTWRAVMIMMLPRDATSADIEQCRWLAERIASLSGAGTFRVHETDARRHDWSPAMRALHGVDAEHPAPGIEDYCTRFVHEDDRDAVRRHLDLALRHPRAEFDLEYSIVRADAQPRRLRATLRAFAQPDGSRTVIGAVQDVTDGRLREREPLAHAGRLAILTRLAVTGEMAAGFAHQLSQPLTALMNYASAAARLVGDHGDPRLAGALAAILEQAERAAHVARRLRALAGVPLGDVVATDLNALLHDTVPLLEPLARGVGVGVRFEPCERLPRVHVDPAAIQLAVINLACNAIEASSLAGIPGLVVELGTGVTDQGVEIVVRDRGVGLGEEAAEQLFLPLYTTKAAAAGLGLGIANSIAAQHAGRVTLTSNAGGGVTARLSVPASASGEGEQEQSR